MQMVSSGGLPEKLQNATIHVTNVTQNRNMTNLPLTLMED